MARAQAQLIDLELHTLGWKAFQDLCSHVIEERLGCLVEVYREAQDGGQDAVFIHSPKKGKNIVSKGTTQCKFFGKRDQLLKRTHLNKEIGSISDLVGKSEADTYILITNARVDAPVAIKLKNKLRSLGVRKPHVLGREFLTLSIKTSSRLRAMVPRVYGLGDLSQILDERRADQTRFLLGTMLPTLKVYVSTNAHRRAVSSLVENNIVLLLGNPATGKSSIAAILSTIQVDKPGHRCFKVDSPDELMSVWNPHEPGGFYWIDDAFGPNNLRPDFVDTWISIMPKVAAAIHGGNQFVLTSRRHIYEAAKPKLGNRNYSRFIDQSAIVGVDNTTTAEQCQILYNHVKLSSQPTRFKRLFKDNEKRIIKERILPEISRRLGNHVFTANIGYDLEKLIAFIREPKQHLLEVIENLTKPEVAALTLVFLHRGRMSFGSIDSILRSAVLESFGQNQEAVSAALQTMKGSFLVEVSASEGKYWTYQHPTISDAVSSYLMSMEGMALFYLRGAKMLAILTEVACIGAPSPHADALLIGEQEFSTLLSRFDDIEDSPSINVALFSFLIEKASDRFLRMFVRQHERLLSRAHTSYWGSGKAYDSKIKLYSRLFLLGELPTSLRGEASRVLVSAVIDDLDTSFVYDGNILALIEPLELFELKDRIRHEILYRIPGVVKEMVDEADSDADADNFFDDLESSLRTFENLVSQFDESSLSEISDARAAIDRGKVELKASAEARQTVDHDFDWDEDDGFRRGNGDGSVQSSTRSLFDDVDG